MLKSSSENTLLTHMEYWAKELRSVIDDDNRCLQKMTDFIQTIKKDYPDFFSNSVYCDAIKIFFDVLNECPSNNLMTRNFIKKTLFPSIPIKLIAQLSFVSENIFTFLSEERLASLIPSILSRKNDLMFYSLLNSCSADQKKTFLLPYQNQETFYEFFEELSERITIENSEKLLMLTSWLKPYVTIETLCNSNIRKIESILATADKIELLKITIENNLERKFSDCWSILSMEEAKDILNDETESSIVKMTDFYKLLSAHLYPLFISSFDP